MSIASAPATAPMPINSVQKIRKRRAVRDLRCPRALVSAAFCSSPAPASQLEKSERDAVFLPFPRFIPKQALSPPVLGVSCGLVPDLSFTKFPPRSALFAGASRASSDAVPPLRFYPAAAALFAFCEILTCKLHIGEWSQRYPRTRMPDSIASSNAAPIALRFCRKAMNAPALIAVYARSSSPVKLI